MRSGRAGAVALFLSLAGIFSLSAKEYFVSPIGDDTASGLERGEAFATVQMGVNALAPGDTLTILPGEYFGAVVRKGLGSEEADTLIRAEIPGTALIRGDVDAPAFQSTPDGIWVAPFEGDVQAVNEVDSLTSLHAVGSVAEVKNSPGTYFYDPVEKRLYLATTDLAPATSHRYTICLIPSQGFLIEQPVRVTVDGLAATGFHSALQPPSSPGKFAVWGIIFFEPKNSVIRNSTAYLNGGGIVMSSTLGGNLIEKCTGYANSSPSSAEGGNILFYSSNNDIIRQCVAYRAKNWGFRHYGAFLGPALIEDCLGWGNAADVFVKGDANLPKYSMTRRMVATGKAHALNVENVLIGDKNQYLLRDKAGKDSVWVGEEGLDQDAEFADPINFDFSLQSTSTLRDSGPDGSDRGPTPFKANTFFVRPEGDDSADGLSVETSWKSLERALRDLRPGDSLYLGAGNYSGTFNVTAGKPGAAPIWIRARGTEKVTIVSPVAIAGSHGLRFERIDFAATVDLEKSTALRFDNCRFLDAGIGLRARAVDGLRITHSEFLDFDESGLQLEDCDRVFLSSNLFSGKAGTAVSLAGGRGAEAKNPGVWYSDYNGYTNPGAAWSLPDGDLSLEEVQSLQGTDRESRVIPEGSDMATTLRGEWAGWGRLGRNIGFDQEILGYTVHMTPPRVHSLSPTTANLRWTISRNASVKLAWGETPDCEEEMIFNGCLTNNPIGSFSLTDLKPGTKYFFQIREVVVPKDMETQWGKAEVVDPQFGVISFTTPAGPAEPKTYYVAPDGDDARTGLSRKQAWQTIQKAGNMVVAGDTVLIAEGIYSERVRILGTGADELPVTFRSLPGEKVLLDSDSKRLDRAFIITGKKNIVIEGFYLNDFRMAHWHTGAINIVQSDDVTVRKCFRDGRTAGYSSSFLDASGCKNLSIENCVILAGIYGIDIRGCEGFRLVHNVFVRTYIEASKIIPAGPDNVVENNIFTDSLPGKVKVWLHIWGSKFPIEEANNCYFLRVPDAERKLFWMLSHEAPGQAAAHVRMSLAEFSKKILPTNSIIANPEFAGMKKIPEELSRETSAFPIDGLFRGYLDLDFADFFSENPILIKRGIGLQPEVFQKK